MSKNRSQKGAFPLFLKKKTFKFLFKKGNNFQVLIFLKYHNIKSKWAYQQENKQLNHYSTVT